MKSTTRFTKNMRGIECLNCTQPISENDNFCSNCGQVNDELPLSIKQFISEFFAGFFSFDTRFFKTFIPLLFKPGKVSKDYIEGKRRRYVNPFQLYLHVTILFFLIQGLFSAIDQYKVPKKEIAEADDKEQVLATDSIKDNTVKDKEIYLKDTLPNEVKNSTKLKNNNNKINDNNIDTIKIHIDSVFANSDFLDKIKNSQFSNAERDSIYLQYFTSNVEFMAENIVISTKKDWRELQNISKIQREIREYTIEKFKTSNVDYTPPKDALNSFNNSYASFGFAKKINKLMEYDKEHENATALEALDSLGYENSRWNVFYFKKAQEFNTLKKDDSKLNNYLDEMVSKTSAALFFLLPIFTLFFSLLYIRHKRNYTEHLVFVFNIQTVFFLLLLFSIVLNRFINTDIGFIISIFILIFLFYLYKSLRNFYNQGRLKTIIKFILLNLSYFFLSILGGLIIAFITFAL